MKRRSVNVNNQKTKVQLAVAVVDSKECKVLVFDHLKKLCFKEMNGDDNTMKLSLGTFSKQPFKYNFIRRLLVTKLSKNDSEKIVESIEAIVMTELTASETTTSNASETVAEDKIIKSADTEVITEKSVIINIRDDIAKEKSCYDHCLVRVKNILDNIEALRVEGVPVEYINTRYPDIKEMMATCASRINEQWLNLSFAENKVADLKEQLKICEYNLYLAQEAYISVMRDQISCLETLDDLSDLISEDMAEVKRINRIRELEEELATLKGKSKFGNVSPQEESIEKEIVTKPVELTVELATDAQDREIRYLANHFYQVRRGNEEPNPVIYRKIAELSEALELPKSEFCKKVLSISYVTYDRNHRGFMNSLGLHLYGELKK